MSKKEYIPLFARVLQPKIFTLLIVGGLISGAFSIHAAIIESLEIGLLSSVFQFMVLFPGALFLRSQGNKLLIKNIAEVFSENSSTTKEIFCQEEDFKKFASKARSTIYNVKEVLVILVVIPIALYGNGLFQELINSSNIMSVFGAERVFVVVYWSTLPIILMGSMTWVIFGFIWVTIRLNKEKNKLKISKAIEELRFLSNKKTENRKTVVESLDLSFTELKEALTPMHKIGQGISISLAIIGFLYALPALTIFIFTRDLSPFIYYGFCVFFAVLSFGILGTTEFGIRRVWEELKSETIMTLEKLCDKVKFQCVKSICTSEDYQSRERYVKDVTFVKSAILDLREVNANNYTLKTASQIAVTVVLPYIPIILKIAKVY